MVAVGELVLDRTTLVTSNAILSAPAGQVFKILFCGVDMSETNVAIQLYSATDIGLDLNKKGTGYGGNVSGSYIGTSGETGAQVTRNIPLFIDDDVNLRVEGSPGIYNMVLVVYMRVQ